MQRGGGVRIFSSGSANFDDCAIYENVFSKLATTGSGINNAGTLILTNTVIRSSNTLHLKQGSITTYLLPIPAGRWLPAIRCVVYREACDTSDSACKAAVDTCSLINETNPGGNCKQATFNQPCDWVTQPKLLGQTVYTLPQGTIDTDFPYACAPGILGGNGSNFDEQDDARCGGFCPAGYTCPEEATVNPTPCEPAHFCPEGSAVARACPKGTFSAVQGLESEQQCRTCPAGSSCSIGVLNHTLCSQGTIQPEAGQSECVRCEAGKYQGGTGQTACFTCTASNYCPAGSSAELPCPGGRYSSAGGLAQDTQCSSCPAGSSCSTGSLSHTPCSPGTVQPEAGQGSCVKCDAGKYQHGSGETVCFECVAGSYCEAGSSAALPCPSGRHQNGAMTALNVSMTSFDDCVACPSGSFCSTGAAEPTACSPGTVQPATEQGTCAKCAAGKYQDGSGETACFECVAGSYCAEGASAALPCPSGRHQNGTMTALNVSMTSVDDCVECPAGAFCSTGSAEPTACSPGTVQPAIGQATCANCLAGKYQARSGTTTCDECTAGSYCADGAAAPLPCPSGRHQNTTLARAMTSQDDCVECPAGAACATGSAEPGWCAPGSFAPTTGMPICTRCAAGRYQGDEGATACEECTEHSWCGEGSSAPTPCETGTVGRDAGLRNKSQCEPCPAGSWCSAGVAIPCAEGTWSDATRESNMGACEACPTASTSAEGTASLRGCECNAGYYALWHGATLSCEPCPIGANCTESGLTFERLPLDEGYWRAHVSTTDVRRCPGSACEGCGGDACQRTNYTGCRNGTGGAYCGACAESAGPSVYYDHDRGACLPCREANPVPLIVLGSVLASLAVLAAVLVVVRRRRARRQEQPGGDVRSGLAKRMLLRAKRRLWIKLKIAFSFYQISTKVGETYMVVYPPSVETILDFLSFVSLELDGLGLPLACVSLGSFRAKLFFIMGAPVGLLLLAAVVGWARHNRVAVRQALEGRSGSYLMDTLKHSAFKALPMMLRVTFLAFPAVSSLAFKAFQCDDLDASDGAPGPAVMSADLSVVCWDEQGVHTDEYVGIVQLAWLAIVLYPLCVPFVYCLLFWKVRHAVWSDTQSPLSEAISFLTDDYEAAFFFWELVESYKKLLLVGLMSVVRPGEIDQLIIGFIVMLCFLVALLVAKPYRQTDDSTVALASGLGLVMFFFLSLILKYQTLTEAVEDSLTGQLAETFSIDPSTIAVLLLASTLSALVVSAGVILLEEAAEGVRETAKARHHREREAEEKRLATQFTPMAKDAAVLALAPLHGEYKASGLGKAEAAVFNGQDGAQAELAERLAELRVVQERLRDRWCKRDDIGPLCAAVMKSGDPWAHIYKSVWEAVVAKQSMDAYNRIAKRVRGDQPPAATVYLVSPEECEQGVNELPELYAEAVAARVEASRVMQEIDAKVKAKLEPGPLKKMCRACEKLVLQPANDAGGAKRICDIVRDTFECQSMDEVAELLELLRKLDKIELLRFKDRFNYPSAGYRDAMINYRIKGRRHVCELQIGVHLMLVARRGLDGHKTYGSVRNATELKEYLDGRAKNKGQLQKTLPMPESPPAAADAEQLSAAAPAEGRMLSDYEA